MYNGVYHCKNCGCTLRKHMHSCWHKQKHGFGRLPVYVLHPFAKKHLGTRTSLNVFSKLLHFFHFFRSNSFVACCCMMTFPCIVKCATNPNRSKQRHYLHLRRSSVVLEIMPRTLWIRLRAQDYVGYCWTVQFIQLLRQNLKKCSKSPFRPWNVGNSHALSASLLLLPYSRRWGSQRRSGFRWLLLLLWKTVLLFSLHSYSSNRYSPIHGEYAAPKVAISIKRFVSLQADVLGRKVNFWACRSLERVRNLWNIVLLLSQNSCFRRNPVHSAFCRYRKHLPLWRRYPKSA